MNRQYRSDPGCLRGCVPVAEQLERHLCKPLFDA
ncbi:hypothetical protein H206_05362 [Candidatus Electrothrix aarhusensis]|uniref:Uncharacterized protein n=1 Tax=Candidatus Electrothrix aarhusensis TaxID=1859131 RepID=A0A444J4S4_9BACT|nr:hypothetical protein H206_05362 [Candidatus Electrothrix aarhusensis]